MNIPESFRQQFERFSAAMEFSPNRDRAIYCCAHAVLVLVAIVFVLIGYLAAVFAVVVLSLVLSGEDGWQVSLSRRCALAGLIVLAVCAVVILASLPFAGRLGFSELFFAFANLALVSVSLVLWYWAANGLYNAQFRLPPEDTGPW